MSNGNVVMPSQFAKNLTDGDLEMLKDSGIEVTEVDPLEELDLDDPQNGEITIGVLTSEEAAVFADYHKTFSDLDGILRDINSDMLVDAADVIRSGNDGPASMHEAINERVTDEDRKEICKLQRRIDLLKGVLYWRIAERLDAHQHVLGVRSGGRIVRRTGTSPNYPVPTG